MTFSDYQELVKRTARVSQDKEKDIFLSLLGLGGEAGEVLDAYKKMAGHGHDFDQEKLMKEMGDALWYMADLCTKFGFSLDEVAKLNIDKLNKRYPGGFSSERSQNRSPEDK
jgi:NTP pyrophosphatase (non-canonical NTP hydrolase)